MEQKTLEKGLGGRDMAWHALSLSSYAHAVEQQRTTPTPFSSCTTCWLLGGACASGWLTTAAYILPLAFCLFASFALFVSFPCAFVCRLTAHLSKNSCPSCWEWESLLSSHTGSSRFAFSLGGWCGILVSREVGLLLLLPGFAGPVASLLSL